MKKSVLFAVVCLLVACGKNSSQKASEPEMDEELKAQYQTVMDLLQEVKSKMNKSNLAEDYETVVELMAVPEVLQFEYNPIGMDSATQAVCKELQEKVESTREALVEKLAEVQQEMIIKMYALEDSLIESELLMPIYLEKGDVLHFNLTTDNLVNIKIFNADKRSTLKTYLNNAALEDSIQIAYRATYLVQLQTRQGATYVNGYVGYKTKNTERILQPRRVAVEEVEAERGDFLVKQIKGVEMKNLFEEPRKFTLRGQLKAAFSGSSRALVAIQVPKGATDILYSLRISTNETSSSKDGEFYKDLDHSYHRIKMLGLPIYESNRRSGLIATLLGENVPIREEDAYINMYVFFNAAQAKKFQDKVDASTLQYSVDYSTLGTQSCNGRIPCKGYKTVYLAFENERMRYNNYIWLEVVSALPNIEYVKPKFVFEKEDE